MELELYWQFDIDYFELGFKTFHLAETVNLRLIISRTWMPVIFDTLQYWTELRIKLRPFFHTKSSSLEAWNSDSSDNLNFIQPKILIIQTQRSRILSLQLVHFVRKTAKAYFIPSSTVCTYSRTFQPYPSLCFGSWKQIRGSKHSRPQWLVFARGRRRYLWLSTHSYSARIPTLLGSVFVA